MEPKDKSEFENIIKELITNSTVQKMKNYRQHCDTSCYEHCYSAAYYCYKICKKLKLDYVSATRAAMLHDLFLYDWRDPNSHKRWHAFNHPRTSYENASKIFSINEKEKDIILKHMWPTTLVPPRYIEGFVLTLVDKYCAIEETSLYCLKKLKSTKIFKYAYILLGIVFIKNK